MIQNTALNAIIAYEARQNVETEDVYSQNFKQYATPNTLILNMGPQHPSTHGALRILLELDGEYIRRAEPILGYIHRMQEKMGEIKSWSQYLPNMGRVDYLHAIAWNWAYCGAVERLAGIEVPERAECLRILLMEMNRISSHLLWWGAYLLDLGAFTPIMYAFEDRERIMDTLQEITGSRLTYCCFRFGGVSADATEIFLEGTRAFVPYLRERLPMYKALVTENIILRHRIENIGFISQDMCRQFGATGPVLRGSAVPQDTRRTEPFSLYPDLDFEVPSYAEGDAMARYLVRIEEMEQSLRIIEQILKRLPKAAGTNLPPKAPKANWKPNAPGEASFAVESARGKIIVHVMGDGGPKPYRIKLSAPIFSNLHLFAACSQGCLLADAVAILGSLDLVIPEIDR
ncbi:NADH-quinone oxidoreductase subunit D 2 [Desulfovibrionales bacterium]